MKKEGEQKNMISIIITIFIDDYTTLLLLLIQQQQLLLLHIYTYICINNNTIILYTAFLRGSILK